MREIGRVPIMEQIRQRHADDETVEITVQHPKPIIRLYPHPNGNFQAYLKLPLQSEFSMIKPQMAADLLRQPGIVVIIAIPGMESQPSSMMETPA